MDSNLITRLDKDRFLERFFKKDPTLWKEEPGHRKVIENRLGWLRSAEWMLGKLYELDQLTEEILREKIRDVVLLGMGGSSLAAEVMAFILKPKSEKYPRFHVLDTTDYRAIQAVERKLRLPSALFVVSSKSGSTVETTSQFQYFYDKVSKLNGRKKGDEAALATGRHFIAITDAGSQLEKLAQEKKFRRVFINPSDIGGRYSALSYFGLVPAALIGVPVHAVIGSAVRFLRDTETERDLDENQAIYLGALLGQYAKYGKDKLTFWMTPALQPFGPWLEQLIAESTGKEKLGILPIEGETPGEASLYGEDRVFVTMRLAHEKSTTLKAQAKKMIKAGHPVIEMTWPERTDLGAEFLRWEIVTGVASAVLGINPFDEPNVKESKDNTGRLLEHLKNHGKFPVTEGILKIKDAGFKPEAQALNAFFGALKKSGYIAILAYLERSPATQKALDGLRHQLGQALKVPVLVGFGPRYLHSIGQYYKGGPAQGIFLELFAAEAPGGQVPGTHYRFDQLKHAQALGDKEALESKKLPVLAVELQAQPLPCLAHLQKFLKAYFKEHPSSA